MGHQIPVFAKYLAASLALVVSAAALLAAPAEPLPGPADVRQQFADARYRDVIRNVTRLSSQRDWLSNKDEAYELLSMKGESYLYLKEGSLAGAAFDAAAKVGSDDRAALARATAILIKRSSGLHYAPKATTGKHASTAATRPAMIDIVQPDSRKTALSALYQDEKDTAAIKLTPATSPDGKSIQAVLDAAPLAAHLRDFEIAANGNDEETRSLREKLSTHGRELLTDMGNKMNARVDAIIAKAMAVDRFQVPVGNGRNFTPVDRFRKHGLENMEPRELQDMMVKTDKVLAAVKRLIDALTPEGDFYKKVMDQATSIHDKAAKTLKIDFTEQFMTRNDAMK